MSTNEITLGGLRLRAWPLPFHVPFQSVDHAGIVFYAQVHSWCHLAYEEWYTAAAGESFAQIFESRGFATPVVGSQARYVQPIRHGERLIIDIHCERLGNKSFTLGFALLGENGDLKCEVQVTHATVAFPGFVAMPVPEYLRALLSQPLEEDPS